MTTVTPPEWQFTEHFHILLSSRSPRKSLGCSIFPTVQVRKQIQGVTCPKL